MIPSDCNILIGMESSGVIREAFRAAGHNAYSCDLQPADDGSLFHIQGDIVEVLKGCKNLDLVGFHPPCTFLCGSGIHWNGRGRGWNETFRALGFVAWLMSHDFPWYLENPVGLISSVIRKPDQVIQPYEFGDDASKKTCLWLHGLPKLKVDPSKRCNGRIVEFPIGSGKMVERWSNQTDSGQNKLAPSDTRWKERSRSYPSVAKAMAQQWATQKQLSL